MAKILVADDNSNVQKTVVLALADLGVEIFSVNNGEAAVRKLPEVSPDLILADIFMPVRNGYEVCEYVKKDSRFARIPVVLLVGAFDPLDEREAQRVRADGILKKPFVPTDPLINMVKTLLDRALGEQLVAVTAPKTAVATKTKGGSNEIAELHPAAPEASKESAIPGPPPPIKPVAFVDGEPPVAFVKLLETPAREAVPPNTGMIETIDDEQVLTSSRPATLGDPVFWRNDPPEQEREAEEPQEPQEPASVSQSPEARPWNQGEDPLPRREHAILLQPIEPLELVRDEADEASSNVVDSQSVELDPAAQAPLTVDSGKPGDLAANPIEWMATAPPEHPGEVSEPIPGWSELTPEVSDTIRGAETTNQSEVLEQVSAPEPVEPSEHVPTPVLVPILTLPSADAPGKTSEIHAQASVTSALPVSPQPAPLRPKSGVEPGSSSESAAAEAHSIPEEKWADLAESLHSDGSDLAARLKKLVSAPPATPAIPASAQTASWLPKPEVAPGSPSQSAVETAHSIPRQDWADLAQSLHFDVSKLVTHPNESVPAPATPGVPDSGQGAVPLRKPEVAPSSPAHSTEDTVRSTPRQNWADLAESLDPGTTKNESGSVPVATIPVFPTPAQVASWLPKPEAVLDSPPQTDKEPVRSIRRQDWAELAESVRSDASKMTTHQNRSEPTSAPEMASGNSQRALTGTAEISPPDPALVEAVVQRVLEKMRPQVVDIITKEFLRPIVQALVHREIEKH